MLIFHSARVGGEIHCHINNKASLLTETCGPLFSSSNSTEKVSDSLYHCFIENKLSIINNSYGHHPHPYTTNFSSTSMTTSHIIVLLTIAMTLIIILLL